MLCPDIDPQLIRYLATAFPDRAVNPSKEDPSVAFGEQKVIRHLRAKLLEQEGLTDVPPES